MGSKGSGYFGHSREHGLHRKGIPTHSKGIQNTKYNVIKSKGKSKLTVGLPPYSKAQIKHISKLAEGKEWIAELNMVNGDILIDDIQVSKEINHSYLRWNKGDEAHNVGYIHYHPATLIPEFSAQDFVLAMEIHDIRENKHKYPYTIMGLVYPDKNGKLHLRMYAIKPKKDHKKKFEGREVTERDLQKEIKMLIKNKELMKLNNISGGL